jgi:formylglycine-generating enzyme required for sulfatase activity
MGANEVNNAEMRDVLQWAYDNDLIVVTNDEVLPTGGTNGLIGLNLYASEILFDDGVFSILPGRESFPCLYMSWYGAVAYCNYRSLMEGKEVCYDLSSWSCDFGKTGYRLPTEAEWEYGARGGAEGNRFPWIDSELITHSRANYRSSTNNWYDVSPTRGFHPNWAGNPLRTSPVGFFAPNGYGLYDMCGNVWEWCWDWAATYSSVTQTNPTGPVSGTYKIFRGGSNFTTAERVTCAVRYISAGPAGYGFDIGFRIARSDAQSAQPLQAMSAFVLGSADPFEFEQPELLNQVRVGQVFTVQLPTQLGGHYILEFRDTLSDGAWTALSSVAGDGSIKDLADTNATSVQRFYRVRLERRMVR